MRHALAEQRFFRGNPSPVQNIDVTSRKKHLAQFVDKVDGAIYGINYYPPYTAIGYPNTYQLTGADDLLPLDIDFSRGQCYSGLQKLGLGGKAFCQFRQICRWKLENKK